jgi:hypothetical protein
MQFRENRICGWRSPDDLLVRAAPWRHLDPMEAIPAQEAPKASFCTQRLSHVTPQDPGIMRGISREGGCGMRLVATLQTPTHIFDVSPLLCFMTE